MDILGDRHYAYLQGASCWFSRTFTLFGWYVLQNRFFVQALRITRLAFLVRRTLPVSLLLCLAILMELSLYSLLMLKGFNVIN